MRNFTFLLFAVFLFTSINAYSQYTHRQPENYEFSESDNRVLPFSDARAINPEAEMQYQMIKNSKNVVFYEGFEEWNGDAPFDIPDTWKRYRTTLLNEDPFPNEITMPASEELNWYANNPDAYPYGQGSYADYVQSGQGSLGCFWDAPDFTWAVTPEFSIPDSESNIVLNFWAWLANNFESNWITKFHVRLLSDGEWISLYSYDAESEGDNIYDEMLTFNLNAFKGKTVQLAFIHEWNDGIQMAIDEVYVGAEINDDFAIGNFTVNPTFGLLPGEEISITADISSLGLNSGAVDVSLIVNDETVETVTTEVLETGVNSEFVLFEWTPADFGEYTIRLEIPEDDITSNNFGEESLYVHHYLNLAEDFENFDFDELGIPILIWPPVDWDLTDPDWVFNNDGTTLDPVFDEISGIIAGRPEAGEQALISAPVTIGLQDEFLAFYLEGVNNNVDVGDNEIYTPQGVQGFSTFQLKYSMSPDGPWTNLGEPVAFENVVDEDDNLIQSANERRFIEHDITGFDPGTYYFAFTATSTFDLIETTDDGEFAYNSFVFVDNVYISGDPENAPLFYQITVPLNEGEVPYKYFLVVDDVASWDNSEWPGDPNRTVNVTGELTIEDVWGQQPEAKEEVDNTTKEDMHMVTFKVDMKDAMLGEVAFDPAIHKVFISGELGEGFSWIMPGEEPLLEMTTDGSVVPVAVDDILLSEDRVQVFPNPASDFVSINAETTINLVEVFNLTGSKVFSRELNDNQYQINTEGLENAVYIIKVTTEEGIAVQKMQILR